MLRFEAFERLGIRVAAMSEQCDGDCGWQAATPDARRYFLERCGTRWKDLVCPRQMHGTEVAVVRESDRGKGARGGDTAIAVADGLITEVPGLPLGITVADCVPVFACDPVRRAGGLMHAGRAGTLHRAAEALVQALCAQFHVSPGSLHALIGPSAGPCCYEVSAEMAQAYADADLPVRGRHLDLWAANRLQLEQAGLPPAHVHVAALCTICGNRFHSYRAGAASQRNLAVFVL